MKLKVLLRKDTLWYFFALAGLFLLLYMGKDFIIDTYVYALSLSAPIFVISYMLLKRINALRYYFHVTGCVFFVVWFSFYILNVMRSKSVCGHITKYICVEHYTPIGRSGRASSSGIQCKYKGEFIQLSATQTSEKLYKIYGDSVVNHLKVRLIIKETLPHVYYIDKVLITYKKIKHLSYISKFVK